MVREGMRVAALALALLAGVVPAAADVLIIAHRGSSGERPEHTLAAYARAIDQGAAFIEPDIVATKDGVLVARHENEISETTDVASRPEFAGRKATKTIDGKPVTGWFTEDFTLAELKTLRARERLPALRPASAAFDGQEPVPTLAEVIELARSKGAAAGRPIGLYPELKHPSYFQSIGLPLEARLVETLRAGGLAGRDAPVFIQSFEVGSLQALRGMTGLRLVQLIAANGAPADWAAAGKPGAYADMLTGEGLAAVRAYADGVGLEKALLVPRGPGGEALAPTDLVARAKAAGLLVHAWTFRSENAFLPAGSRRGDPADPAFKALHGDWAAEYQEFRALGVDGVFSDFPAHAVAALRPTQ